MLSLFRQSETANFIMYSKRFHNISKRRFLSNAASKFSLDMTLYMAQCRNIGETETVIIRQTDGLIDLLIRDFYHPRPNQKRRSHGLASHVNFPSRLILTLSIVFELLCLRDISYT